MLAVFLLLALSPLAAQSADTLESSPTSIRCGIPPSEVMESGLTPFGTVGMSNVISAEPLSKGHLGMQVRGNFYQQAQAGTGTPAKDAQITTLSVGAALGLNDFVDGFAETNVYNLRNNGAPSTGLGSSVVGLQGTLPLPDEIGVKLGLQLAGIFGTSHNPITTTLAPTGDQGATGWDYLETRNYTDLMARMAQSLIYTVNEVGVKLHFNEGVISSFQMDKRVLLVTGAGVQFAVVPPLVLGLEINDRTFIQVPSASDPLWVTPSLLIRTPAHLNFSGGADISLSRNQPSGSRTLEPWRAFGAISFSYNPQAENRFRKALEARKICLEKERLLALPKTREKKIVEAPPAPTPAPLPDCKEPMVEAPKRSEAENQLLRTEVLQLDAVYFKTARVDLSTSSQELLSSMALMLVKYPKLKFEVSGHTDNVGSQIYNMRLSQSRADVVRAYMIRVAPELRGRLTARGYGFSVPKVNNNTAEGRTLNRRMELRVLNPEVLHEYNP